MSKVSRELNMRDKPRKRSTVWKRVVSAMAAIVVFCTVYALVLPAITMSEDPICGQQAHEHTDACYRTEIRVPDCAAAAHVHGKGCTGTLENPACGFGEQVLHTHDGRCYDQKGQLICQLPELQEHIHSEACGKTEQKLICTQEETPGHTHAEACYEHEKVLICQEPEQQPHAHGDECYQLAEEPTCEQDHEHTQECYERLLICTQEEVAGHTHGDSCYEEHENLICTEAEQEGHTHGETCYEVLTNVTCELQQVADHLHTPSCFNEAGERICGLISGVVHVHDDTCFKVVHLDKPELICSIPEHVHVDACFLDASDLPPVQKDFYCERGAHEHIETCYDATGILICTIPVHTHDVSCKVPDYDPEADLETAENWEATLEDLSLTGRWPEDLLNVAVTQLGYRESKQNVVWQEDGSVKGYTRYGAWYGAPYVDWSAAFVSFCVEYANISGLPQDSSCESYRSALETMGLLREPMNYLPKPGDLVLFDIDTKDDEVMANRMGIVSELMLSEAGELTTVKVLVGDADGEVKYLTYDLLSNMILSYVETPAGESKVLICNQDHDHTDDCYGFKLFYSDDILYAEVLVHGVNELPAAVTLRINPVTAANDPAGYSSMVASLTNRMQESPYYLGDASFYQMQLLLDDEIYELPEGAKTTVDVSFHAPVFTPEAMDGAAKVETFLLTQDGAPLTDLLSGTVSADMSQAQSSGDGSVVEDGEFIDSELSLDHYQVEQAEEDTYNNASGGLTGVGFESDMVTTFAVVLSNTTKTGQFWERVFSASELTSGGTYMIVSAEGNYALRGSTSSSSNYTAVTIQAQKGEEDPDAAWDANAERNTRYYTITTTSGGAVSNNLYWTITKSGSSYTVRNQNTSNYLYLSSSSLISSRSANVTLTYVTPENCWRIAKSGRYLRNEGSGSFGSTTSDDGDYSGNVDYYHTRDMLIFKLSDTTSLTIPDDVVYGADGGIGDGSSAAPEKPDYGEFIKPTGSLAGETELTKDGVTVKGQYYSDPATSDIETQYRQDSYEASQVIDGKVVTDKSVIYMNDDYDAFDTYPANTFSVTMSTLGQEYEIPYQYSIKTPVDVVFVLDVSGSMTSNSTDQGENPDRVVDLCNAVNASMAQIMADHEANRVGISIYSSGAWQLLPLDRYTANNGQYLVTTKKTFTHSPTGRSFTINHLLGSSSLRNAAGTSFANAGSTAVQGVGTYTQAGIAMGNEIFEAIGDDTTYTTTIGEGENERPYTVTRQPVYILVSDGEPTHSTNIYNDVLKGPHYGNGVPTPSISGQGIHGYYTVLTANYYKRAVSIQYEKPAMFYSIGMGIHETADGPLVSTSQTGDNYKRAVLNPQPSIIQNLTTNKSKSTTTDQLKGMLLNTFEDDTVNVDMTWPEKWYGVPHENEPVLQPNPYTNNYSYADGAYFGDLPESELKKIFDEIYQSSVTVSPYGFILYQNSSVNILDNIGDGMEIKGIPVLRYNGVNYSEPEVTKTGNTVAYVYHGTVTDPYIPDRTINLSEITVTVTTNDDGTQTLFMYVPDTALPTYTPELIGQQFYYEQLPVRLIYQVGLTAESEAEVLALSKTGGTKVFYTNQWENEEDISTATLLPSTANPFYYDADGDGSEPPYKAHRSLKSEDTTQTVDYHVDCYREIETIAGDVLIEVLHMQGNNGKLVFEVDTVDIPVEKKWDEGINSDIMNPVEAVVYKVTESVDEEGAIIRNAEAVQTLTLSADNQWKAVIAELQQPDDTWYYALAESPVAGYSVTYDRETIRITTDGGDTFFNAVKLDNTGTAVTMTNSVAVQLPSTGGGGTLMYTLGGLLIMAAAILLYGFDCKRRREESFPH